MQFSVEVRFSRLRAVGGEGSLVSPHSPDDAGELVRHGDGRDIVTTTLLRRPRPRLKVGRVSRALRVPQERARAMDQQHPQVHVALRADRAQPPTEGAGVLPRRQAKEARKVAARVEASNVTDERNEGRRRQEPNPGHGLQECDLRELSGHARELPFDVAHVRLEHTNLVTGARDGGAHQHRHDGGGIGQQRADLWDDVLGPDGNEDANLAKQASQGVEPRRARGEPRRAETVQGRDRLVLDALDGHRMDVVITRGLE